MATQWVSLAPLPSARQECGVTVLGSELVLVGGIDAGETPRAEVFAYDPVADRWRTLAPLPAPLHHPNVGVVDGRLYVAGALTGINFAAVGVTLEYDPVADSWTSRRAMPTGTERGYGGVGVIGGRLYVAGGVREGTARAEFSAYEPASDSWTVLPPMAVARDHLVGAVVGGRLYALAGRSGVTQRGQVEIYDPVTGAWSSGRAMPTPRGGGMGGVLGGRIVVMGGEGNPAAGSNGVFGEVEVYDPASDSWAVAAPMRTPRHGTGAVAIGDLLIVPGGAGVVNFGALAVNEALRFS